MSSSAAAAPATATATAANTASRITSAAKSVGWQSWVAAVFGIVGIGLMSGAISSLNGLAGNTENWNAIQPKIASGALMVGFGILTFAIAAIAYFSANMNYVVYFNIIVAAIALGISILALGVAAITR